MLIVCAILANIAVCQAAITSPPSYFALTLDRRQGDVGQVKLHAPRHLSAPELASPEQIIGVQQKRALDPSRHAETVSDNSRSSASNENDKGQSIGYLGFSYYAPLNISRVPPQTVFVQLDTGSADLWVVSSSCLSQQCQTDRIMKFDETKSSTFRLLQVGQDTTGQVNQTNVTVSAQGAQATGNRSIVSRDNSERRQKRRLAEPINYAALATSVDSSNVPFSVVYQDGTAATGSLAVDDVMLANLPSMNQIIGLVNDTNVTLAQQGISGVLGMGFPRGSAIARSLLGTSSNASATPLLTTILSNNNNSYPIFTLLLNSTGGSLTLGAADSNVLATEEDRGQVEWHDVVPFPSGNTAQPPNATLNRDAQALDSYLYWALGMTAAGYGGKSISLETTYSEVGRNPLALIDSGAPGIVGPIRQVDALFSQITGARHVGAGRYVVPCTTQGRMYFSFGGRNYTLLPDDYIIGPASGNSYLCLAWPAASAGGNDGIDWILGQPFLRGQYSLFSLGIAGREAPKIGLYPLRAPADATQASSVFASEPIDSVSAYVKQATPVLTTLPNSLVTISAPVSTLSYAFVNATSTPSLGLVPSRAIAQAVAPSTYEPILTATMSDVRLPVLASPVQNIPVPPNPAERESDAAHGGPSASGQHWLSTFILQSASFLIFLILQAAF